MAGGVPAWIGTSGWQYADWRQRVYPAGVPQSQWLPLYAERFATVEINSAFYRLPERTNFEKWAAAVPRRFVFAVKASRYLTHIKRLREPAEPVAKLLERAGGLGAKLGPVLLQLPPTLRANPQALGEALGAFPAGVRVAVEFRHPSWETAEVRALLERHDAACCAADRRGPLSPRWRTATWGYARFHEGRAQPPTRYGRQALQRAIAGLRDLYEPGEDLFVYFNNDHLGSAVVNAEMARRLLASAGWEVPSGSPARAAANSDPGA